MHDAERSESEQIDRSVLLVPTLLPPCQPSAESPVWSINSDADKSLRVCFVTSHYHGPSDDWPETRRFLPDTLFFRLVATLVQDVRRTSDRFKDLYRDRVVIRANEHRYLLSHDHQHHRLDLTVYGGDGCESAPSAVLVKLRSCLDQMVDYFGVKYRFEAHCTLRGELGWYALDDDLCNHDIGKLWLSPAEPEPEEQEAHPPESEAPQNPNMALRFHIVSMQERRYDFFINHAQASGQDQCGKLALLLEKAGATVWYDMQAQDLTAQGMEKGISESRNVIIFLSDNVMGRPFCNAEQRWAKQYNCNLIGVVETDSRHCPADFAKEKERAPVDLKHLLDDVEFIDFERRAYKEKAMIEEILRRGNTAPSSEEPEPEPVSLPEGVPLSVQVSAPPARAYESVAEWLQAIKLQVCYAALAEQGYGEDLDMLVDGDEEEAAVMLAAVEGIDGVKLPIVKKFKRELAKLRGQGERFE